MILIDEDNMVRSNLIAKNGVLAQVCKGIAICLANLAGSLVESLLLCLASFDVRRHELAPDSIT